MKNDWPIVVTISLLLISTIAVEECWTYRILAISPTPANSHQIVFHAIVEKLAERGHELVVLTTNPVETDNPNVTQIDLSITYQSRLATENFFKTRGLPLVNMGMDDIPWIIEQSLAHADVQNLIHNHNETFDAVFVEYLGYTPFYAFAELFNTMFIGYTTLEMDATQHEALGNAVHPAVHNPNLMGFYRGCSLFKRVWNTAAYVYAKFYLKFKFYSKFDALIEKYFGPHMAKSTELVKKIDLLFLQQNPLLGTVRPMVPTVVTTSFLHIRPNKPLPQALKAYLDNSLQGAIYFSLGTMVRSEHMDDKMRETFHMAFDGLKYNVLWKRTTTMTSVSNSTSNVFTAPWFPQQDLLSHPNIKLFITQGGLQSIEEAISRGVPLIVIPVFYDQYDNAEMVHQKQIGIRLDRDTLTPDLLQAAIEEVIHNKMYKTNILRLRQAIQDEPMDPRDKVAWWLEYAIRNKEEVQQMRYKGADLPFYQKYFLDVSCFIFIVVTLAITILRLCYYSVMRCISAKLDLMKNKEKSL